MTLQKQTRHSGACSLDLMENEESCVVRVPCGLEKYLRIVRLKLDFFFFFCNKELNIVTEVLYCFCEHIWNNIGEK